MRLTILGPGPAAKKKYVECRCVCGTHKTIRLSHIKAGKIQSCGCLMRETSAIRHAKRRAELAGLQEKECCACKKTLPLTSFFKRKGATLGASSACKKCLRARYVAKKIYVGHRTGPAINIAGQRFGRLLVLDEPAPKRPNPKVSNYSWPCFCDCGNVTWVPSSKLKGGDTRSCGCWDAETRGARATKWPAGVLVKACSRCRRMLPVEHFNADSAMAAGYSSRCKDCVRLLNAKSVKVFVDGLSDKYISLVLRTPLEQLPADLINAKREHIRVQRAIRKGRKTITQERSNEDPPENEEPSRHSTRHERAL